MNKLALAAASALAIVVSASPAAAATLDFIGAGTSYSGNRGMNEGTVTAGGFTGNLFAEGDFASSQVYQSTGAGSSGTFSFALAYFSDIDLDLPFDVLLNGTRITGFSLPALAGGSLQSITGSGTFSGISTTSGIELTYRVAASAPSGAGSVRLNDEGSTFTVDVVADAAVPEPATWGMMLVGMGLVGAGMRSRRRLVTYSAA